MAKTCVYSVFDKVACLYGPLFQAVNDAIACRNVVHMLEKVKPYDRPSFELHRMGLFYDDTGVFIVEDLPTKIDVEIPRFDDVETRKFSFEEREDE